MNFEITIKLLEVILILGSSVFYMMRIITGKTTPSPTTWGLLALLSFLVWITNDSSNGIKENTFIVLLDFIESSVIFILILICGALIKKDGETNVESFKKMWETVFLVIAITIFVVLTIFYLSLDNSSPEIWRTYFYVVFFCEVLAFVPQIRLHFKHPEEERPLPWFFTGIGYLLGLLFIKEVNLQNYLIPCLGILFIFMSLPLIKDRYLRKVPLKEWI